MAWSMSSGEAMPSFSTKIASLIHGISTLLVMNPGTSAELTVSLPKLTARLRHPRLLFGDFSGLLVRLDRADHLDQLHDGHGVEEVHADDLVGPLGDRGDLGDRYRRGVRGENRVRGADRVQLFEDRPAVSRCYFFKSKLS